MHGSTTGGNTPPHDSGWGPFGACRFRSLCLNVKAPLCACVPDVWEGAQGGPFFGVTTKAAHTVCKAAATGAKGSQVRGLMMAPVCVCACEDALGGWEKAKGCVVCVCVLRERGTLPRHGGGGGGAQKAALAHTPPLH